MPIFQEKQKTYLQFDCFLCQISHEPDQYDLNYHVNYLTKQYHWKTLGLRYFWKPYDWETQ